jgi:putative ABC transport system substrate-binding protein
VFLVGTATLFLTHRSIAEQSPTVRRIGFLARGAPSQPNIDVDAFRAELRTLGYVEGQNVLIEFRFAHGHLDTFPALAQELSKLKVDVIVAPSTPAALAAKAATDSIPIVFASVSDPVGSGLVTSLPHPGGNITGMTDAGIDVAAKRFDLLKQLVPQLKRVAALGYPADTVWELTWKEAQAAARQLHLEILPLLVTTEGQLETAFAALNRRVQALFVAPQLFFALHRLRVIELVALARLPAIYEARGYTVAGGLISYGPDYRVVFGNAAHYVDKILQGARPADLPVEQPTEYELVINLKTAKALGLKVPQAMLLRAREVIQ